MKEKQIGTGIGREAISVLRHQNEYRNYLEVDLDGFNHNIAVVRRVVGDNCRLMLVVKADAYGHGLAVCGPECAPYADEFAVATIEEAMCLRNAGIKTPILVLGPVWGIAFEDAWQNDISVCVPSAEYAQTLSSRFAGRSRPVTCQIEIDTGFNRLGLRCRKGGEAACAEEVVKICRMHGLEVRGMYAHFSCGDSLEPDDMAFTAQQLELYLETQRLVENTIGLQWPRHCSSSAAMLVHPEVHLDMVRIGMALFGQTQNVERTLSLGFRQLLCWRARVVQVANLPAGDSVAYNRTFTAQTDMRVAVLSIGYADGYKRNYSNRARVILNGRYAKVLGTVCMDYTIVDVTGIPNVSAGDYAVVLGRDGDLEIFPNELSNLNDSVSGEVPCVISARVPRLYYRGG